MRRKRILAAGVLCCFSVLGIFACGRRQMEAADKVYVGVACYNQSDTFISELMDCFEEELNQLEAGELRTVVTVRDAAGQQRKQNDQVKEMQAVMYSVSIWWTGRIRRRSSILPERMMCRSYFLTGSLWRRICGSGTAFIMWARMRRNPASCRESWRPI